MIEAGTLGLRLAPIATGFMKEAELKLRAQKAAKAEVQVTANIGQAAAEMTGFRARQERNPLNLRVEVDEKSVRRAEDRIKYIEHTWKQSDIKRAVRIQVYVAGASLLPILSQGILSVTTAITELGKSAFALPGLLAGVTSAVATMATGFSGVGAALKAANDGMQKSAQTARQYAQAARQLEDAQRGVVNALKSANREIEDQRTKLARGQLSVEQARLNVERANRALREGGFRSTLDYREAVLGVKQANLDLSVAIQQSRRDLQDYYEQAGKAATETDTYKDSLDNLSNAMDRYRKAQFAAAGMSEQFISAMEQLAPAGQDFVLQILRMRGAWENLKASVQTSLFRGLGEEITNLARKQLPTLKTGMQQIAASLNADFRSLISTLGSDANSRSFAKIFDNTAKALRAAQPGIQAFTNGLIRLSEVGSRFLPRMSLAFNKVMARFEAFIDKADKDGSLERWINSGLNLITSLGRSLINVGRILNGVTEAYNKATGNVGGFASTLERQLSKLANYLASPKGQSALISYIRQGQAFMKAIKESLPGIRDLFKVIGDAARDFAEFALPLFSALGQELQKNANLVGSLIKAWFIFKTFKPIGSTIVKSWNSMRGAMETYGARQAAILEKSKRAYYENVKAQGLLFAAQQKVASNKFAINEADRVWRRAYFRQQQAKALYQFAQENTQKAIKEEKKAKAAAKESPLIIPGGKAAAQSKIKNAKAASKAVIAAQAQEKLSLEVLEKSQAQYTAAMKERSYQAIRGQYEYGKAQKNLRIATLNAAKAQEELNKAGAKATGANGFMGRMRIAIGSSRGGGLAGAFGGLAAAIGKVTASVAGIGTTVGIIYVFDQLTAAQNRNKASADNLRESQEALASTLAKGTGSATAATLEENARQLRNRANPVHPDDPGQNFDATKILERQLGISLPEAVNLSLPTEYRERERRLAPADAKIIAAVPNLDEWKQWGDRYKKNGVDETVYGKALNGDPASIGKVEAARKAIKDANPLGQVMNLGVAANTGFAPDDLGAAQEQLPRSGPGGGLRGLSLASGALRSVGNEAAEQGRSEQEGSKVVPQGGLNRRGQQMFGRFTLGAAGAIQLADGSAVIEVDTYPSEGWISDAAPKGISVQRRFPNGAIITIDPENASQYFNGTPVRRSMGGPVWGAGTATSDSIPALLSNGEFVINSRSAKMIGHDVLNQMNSLGRMPGMARKPGHFAPGGEINVDDKNLWEHAWDGVNQVWDGISDFWDWGTSPDAFNRPIFPPDSPPLPQVSGIPVDSSPFITPLPGPASGTPGVPSGPSGGIGAKLGPSGALYIPRLGGSGALADTQSYNGSIGTIESSAPNAAINSDAHILDYLVQVGNAWGFPIGSGPGDTEEGRRLAQELGIPTHFIDGGQHSVNRAIDYGNSELAQSGKLTEFVKDWMSDPSKVAATRQLIYQDPKTGEVFAIYGGKAYTGQAAFDIYGADFPTHQNHIHLALEGVPTSVFTGSGAIAPTPGKRQGIGSSPFGSFTDVFGSAPKPPATAGPADIVPPPPPMAPPPGGGQIGPPPIGPIGDGIGSPMDIITKIGLEILKAIFGFFGIDISGIIDAVMGFSGQAGPAGSVPSVADIPEPDPQILAGLDATIEQYERSGNVDDAEAIRKVKDDYLKQFSDAATAQSMEAVAKYYESLGEFDIAAKIRQGMSGLDASQPPVPPEIVPAPGGGTWPGNVSDPLNPPKPGVGGKSNETPPTWGLSTPQNPAGIGSWPGTSFGSPAWMARLSAVQQSDQTKGWRNKGSRGGVKPDLFLIHTSGPTESGGPGADGQGLVDYLAQSGNSYHYVIDLNGQIVRSLVPTAENAWSAANFNSRSINAAIGGSNADWTRDEWLSNAGEALKTLAALTARDTVRYGIPNNLVEKGKQGSGIGGHDYASSFPGSGTDHYDPGPHFPWDVFMKYVSEYRAGFARGGFVSGPGTGTSDSIPAMLSDGEFVMNAAAVKHWGADRLHAMNRYKDGGLVGYAPGGPVSIPQDPEQQKQMLRDAFSFTPSTAQEPMFGGGGDFNSAPGPIMNVGNGLFSFEVPKPIANASRWFAENVQPTKWLNAADAKLGGSESKDGFIWNALNAVSDLVLPGSQLTDGLTSRQNSAARQFAGMFGGVDYVKSSVTMNDPNAGLLDRGLAALEVAGGAFGAAGTGAQAASKAARAAQESARIRKTLAPLDMSGIKSLPRPMRKDIRWSVADVLEKVPQLQRGFGVLENGALGFNSVRLASTVPPGWESVYAWANPHRGDIVLNPYWFNNDKSRAKLLDDSLLGDELSKFHYPSAKDTRRARIHNLIAHEMGHHFDWQNTNDTLIDSDFQLKMAEIFENRFNDSHPSFGGLSAAELNPDGFFQWFRDQMSHYSYGEITYSPLLMTGVWDHILRTRGLKEGDILPHDLATGWLLNQKLPDPATGMPTLDMARQLITSPTKGINRGEAIAEAFSDVVVRGRQGADRSSRSIWRLLFNNLDPNAKWAAGYDPNYNLSEAANIKAFLDNVRQTDFDGPNPAVSPTGQALNPSKPSPMALPQLDLDGIKALPSDVQDEIRFALSDVLGQVPEIKTGFGVLGNLAPAFTGIMVPRTSGLGAFRPLPGGMDSAYAWANRARGDIGLNPRVFADRRRLQDMYDQNVDDGLHYPYGDKGVVHAIIAHELGHQYHFQNLDLVKALPGPNPLRNLRESGNYQISWADKVRQRFEQRYKRGIVPSLGDDMDLLQYARGLMSIYSYKTEYFDPDQITFALGGLGKFWVRRLEDMGLTPGSPIPHDIVTLMMSDALQLGGNAGLFMRGSVNPSESMASAFSDVLSRGRLSEPISKDIFDIMFDPRHMDPTAQFPRRNLSDKEKNQEISRLKREIAESRRAAFPDGVEGGYLPRGGGGRPPHWPQGPTSLPSRMGPRPTTRASQLAPPQGLLKPADRKSYTWDGFAEMAGQRFGYEIEELFDLDETGPFSPEQLQALRDYSGSSQVNKTLRGFNELPFYKDLIQRLLDARGLMTGAGGIPGLNPRALGSAGIGRRVLEVFRDKPGLPVDRIIENYASRQSFGGGATPQQIWEAAFVAALQDGKKNLSIVKRNLSDMELINSAFETAPRMPQSAWVTRMVQDFGEGPIDDAYELIGETLWNPGFSSTAGGVTYGPQMNRRWWKGVFGERPIMQQILVPEGTPALWFGGKENELLLPTQVEFNPIGVQSIQETLSEEAARHYDEVSRIMEHSGEVVPPQFKMWGTMELPSDPISAPPTGHLGVEPLDALLRSLFVTRAGGMPGWMTALAARGPGTQPWTPFRIGAYENLGYASGGPVIGPGGPKADMIPALLSNGEFVLSAEATKHWGAQTLMAMNKPQKFAPGGLVGPIPLRPIPSPLPEPGSGGGGTGSGGTAMDINTPEGQEAFNSNFPPERVEALTEGLGDLASFALTPKNFGGGMSAAAPPGEATDPRAKLMPAPAGTQHAHPALTAGLKGAFNAAGALAGTAVQMGVAGAVAGGSFGAAAPAAGMAGQAAASLIAAGAQMAGDVAAGAANVISSFLVGTITPAETGQGYGAPMLPPERSQPVTNFQNVHNGNIVTNNLSEYSRLKDRKDAQKSAPFFNRVNS